MPTASHLHSLLMALSSAGVDVRQLRVQPDSTVSLGHLGYSADTAPVTRRRRWSRGVDGTLANVAAGRGEMLEGSGRQHPSLVRRRVKDLRKLVPLVYGRSSRRRSNAGDVGGLLREAADYIACLQLQVKVMRSMIDALSNH